MNLDPQGKECGPRKSKAHPNVYTKDELIELAVKHLGMKKTQARNTLMEDLCRMLFGKRPDVQQRSPQAAAGLSRPLRSRSRSPQAVAGPSRLLRSRSPQAVAGPSRLSRSRSPQAVAGPSQPEVVQTDIEQINEHDAQYLVKPEVKVPSPSPRSLIRRKQYKQKIENLSQKNIGKGVYLGKGTFGTVEKYNYNGLDFAIKTTTKTDSIELYILSSTRHPNILCSAKTFTEGDQVKMLLPLADSTLLKYTEESIPFRSKCELLCDILKGVYYMHDKLKVGHFDLKPTNVLCFNTGGRVRCKIADFGLSQYLKDGYSYNKLTGGTRGYCSPVMRNNILKKITYLDVKADIWATGIIAANLFFEYDTHQIDEKITKLQSEGASQQLIELYSILNKEIKKRNYDLPTDSYDLIEPLIDELYSNPTQNRMLKQFFDRIFTFNVLGKGKYIDKIIINERNLPTAEELLGFELFDGIVPPNYREIGYNLEPPVEIIPQSDNIIKGEPNNLFVGSDLPVDIFGQISRFNYNVINRTRHKLDFSQIVEYLPCYSLIIQNMTDEEGRRYKNKTYKEFFNNYYLPRLIDLEAKIGGQDQVKSCIPDIELYF